MNQNLSLSCSKLFKSSLIMLICLGALNACSHKKSEQSVPQTPKEQVRVLTKSDIIMMKTGTFERILPFNGGVNAPDSTQVSTTVGGTVQRVLVQAGDSVKKNQLLAVLSNEAVQQNYQAQLAQLNNAKASLNLAKTHFEQQKALYAKQFISKMAFDQANNQLSLSRGQYQAQQAQLRNLHKSLSDLKIYAPMTGVVYQRHINAGENIGVGQALFAIANTAKLEITATVDTSAIALIKIGQSVHFQVEGDGQEYTGKVVRINPVANSSNRSFTVYIQVDNHSGSLKVGQYAQGQIVVESLPNVEMVSEQALRHDDGQTTVLYLQNNQVKSQVVKVLAQGGVNHTVAIQGLPENIQYILSAKLTGVKVGDNVRLPTQN